MTYDLADSRPVYVSCTKPLAWWVPTTLRRQVRALSWMLLCVLQMLMFVGAARAQDMERREFSRLSVPDPSIIQAHDGSGY